MKVSLDEYSKTFYEQFVCLIYINYVTNGKHHSHHAWQPVNLDVSHQRPFHLPRVLFTRLMKNWGVPEIIACELLHSGQNFRGICKKDKVECFTPTMVPIIIIHTVEQ